MTQVRAHLVERHGHRRRFRAAANRDLSRPVAGGDIACRRGDVLERTGHPPAEDDAGRDGEQEDHAAGAKEAVSQLVQESLRRLPILQQEHPVRAAGRPIRRQRKGTRHVAAAGDRLHVERKALLRLKLAGSQQAGELRSTRAIQARAAQMIGGDEVHLAVRHLRELFGDGVVERVADGECAEHFFSEQRGLETTSTRWWPIERTS